MWGLTFIQESTILNSPKQSEICTMENVETVINLVVLSVAIGCLCLAVPIGILALRASPWWRRKAKRKKHPTVNKKARDETRRTNAITFPKQPRPETPSLATVLPSEQRVLDYSPNNGDLFPSGYTSAQYHEAGIDDSTINYWGFDRDPGAPSPRDAGVAIAEAMEEGW